MKTLRFILGDQLSRSLSALDDVDAKKDVILMVEVRDETTYVRHHRQKIALVLSAMRHFAESLGEEGLTVDYVRLDDPDNSGSFTDELERAVERHGIGQVIVTEPGEWRVMEMISRWQDHLNVAVAMRPDTRFLASRAFFSTWAEGRKNLRMEFFYREMRKKTGWLMEDGKPTGGRWNYDAENRKALPEGTELPSRRRFEPDATTRRVLSLVEERCGSHFGDLEAFGWAVTRDQALEALGHFVNDCLPRFGDFQDAMKEGAPFLYHAALSPYLNLGLLLPREVVQAAVDAYQAGLAPLAATEGFVRQILGWREFVRGLYWDRMPGYNETNFLDARRPLPGFYWTGETDMNCK
jgi:deoxyribodipyrimidine photolyase-related protein